MSKAFAGTVAVEGFDLAVADGELVCLLGPSGSGKSTLLRMVGGFERPTAGTVAIDGQDVTLVPPERRPTGMAFQSHALWTHMDVFRNVAFGLTLRRLPRHEVRVRVEAVLDQVGIRGYGARMTHQLSGGQQQRVALARSLVLQPKILLLDEPFASLDQHVRERLREEVRDLQSRLGITTLFVTHGQDETLALADRIVVMRDGRAEQVGPPDEVYREPLTPFVAGFVGSMNLVEGAVAGGAFRHGGLALPVPAPDGPATLAVRPEALALEPGEGATIRRVTDFGAHAVVDLDLADGLRLKAQVPDARAWRPGQPVAPRPRAFALYRDSRLLRRAPNGRRGGRDARRAPHVAEAAPRPAPGRRFPFTGRRILEGMRAGASVEVDLVAHADGGFAVLHDLHLNGATTGRGEVRHAPAATLRALRLRDAAGAPTAEPVMLLEDLADLIAREGAHPDALLQLDCKEAAALDPRAIATFRRALAPVARHVILLAGDAEAVRLLAEGVDGLRIGHDPCRRGAVERLERSRDVEGFVEEAVAASPRAEVIYLDLRLILGALDAGADLVAAFQGKGRRVDAYTTQRADAEGVALARRLIALRVD